MSNDKLDRTIKSIVEGPSTTSTVIGAAIKGAIKGIGKLLVKRI